jgi:mono/diheme cytochrome c family protein
MTARTMRGAGVVVGAGCIGLALLLSLGRDPAPAQLTNGLIEKGQQVFLEQGCYGCHTIGKFGTQGIAGDLSHIGARHDVTYLTKWLLDPSAQRPTAHMPKIEMTKADADAVAAYLATLR